MINRVIFKITNLINHKIYIGKKSGDKSTYFGSGKAIINAIKKYGKQNFRKEIIDTAETLIDLNNKEKYWIAFYKANDYKIGYNRSAGGGEGFDFNTMSVESKKKRDIKLKKIRKSKKYSEKCRKNMLEYYKSNENRKKRSENQKKIWENYTTEELKSISRNYSKAGKKAWKNNKERKRKTSIFFKKNNFSKTPEGKIFMSVNRRGGNNPYASPIIIDKKFYPSIQDASNETNQTVNVIRYRLNTKKYKNYKYVKRKRRN